MKRFLVLGLFITSLVACSSKSYVETSEGLSERTIDRASAAQSRLALALKYIELEEYQDAKINLDRAFAYQPDSASIHLGYAYYFQQVKENERAEASYEEALDLAPYDGNIRNNYGVFLCSVKRYDEAEIEFLGAIASPRYNKISNSYENAGQCALENSNKKRALTFFKSAFAHNPQKVTLLLLMAELNYDFADYERAQQLLTRYSLEKKSNPSSLWLSFKLAIKQDKLAKAEQYSQELIANFPLSIQTKKYLANDY